MTTYSTDWSNIDLDSGYQQDLNIIDPLSFKDLLMEINCNLPTIDEKSVRHQFEMDLQSRIQSAREVFNANLYNIINYANDYRNEL